MDFKQLAKLPFSFPFLFFHLTTLNHLIHHLIIFVYFLVGRFWIGCSFSDAEFL